ncbi:MAG: hypothetical protein WD991_01160 [Candidatus Paceibacterota bacterium]
MKFLKYILIILFLAALFVPAENIRAQSETIPDPNYVLLEPIGDFEKFNPTDDKALGGYLNLMIRLFIGLCAVLAVVMIVVGGMEYMTSELISSKEQGKTRITEALLGLLVALGAYALLNTINPDLLKTDLKSLKVAIVEVDIEADMPQTPINGKYKNGATHGNPWDDTVAQKTTLPAYVTLNNPECTTVGQKNCTSTRGLDISKLQAIQYGCKCTLVLTGGTESWLHGGNSGNTTHHKGSATIDLRRSPELDKYLSGGKPLVKWQRYPETGGPYLFEGNHWHIGR